MGSNNGQKGFINEDESFLNDGNTISFGQDTATMYYQEFPYFTGDKIKIVKSPTMQLKFFSLPSTLQLNYLLNYYLYIFFFVKSRLFLTPLIFLGLRSFNRQL